jgi:hypothetical protein
MSVDVLFFYTTVCLAKKLLLGTTIRSVLLSHDQRSLAIPSTPFVME